MTDAEETLSLGSVLHILHQRYGITKMAEARYLCQHNGMPLPTSHQVWGEVDLSVEMVWNKRALEAWLASDAAPASGTRLTIPAT